MRKQLSIKYDFIQIRNLVLHLRQIYLNVIINTQSSGSEQEKRIGKGFLLFYFSC